MQSQLNKALKLAKKTGDRLIVFESPDSDNAFVVMDFDQYADSFEGGCGDDCECDCGHDHEFEPKINEDFEDELKDEDYDFEDDLTPETSVQKDYVSTVKSLTEEELLDKINRDIALWKESQMEVENEEILAEKLEKIQGATGEAEEKNKSKWAIKNEVKENADEIIEEDRHYLEEVKY